MAAAARIATWEAGSYRRAVWFDWQPKPSVELSGLAQLCPPGCYRVLDPHEVPPGVLPAALIAKCHSLLVVCSGTANSRVYAMINLNRLDRTDIDQMPYGFAFDGEHPVPSGVLVQHGNYHPDRTSDLPSDFAAYIAISGTYPFKTMPTNREGSLAELRIPSQEEAFRVVVEQVRIAFPEGARPITPDNFGLDNRR
jgi:hypothetical protein